MATDVLIRLLGDPSSALGAFGAIKGGLIELQGEADRHAGILAGVGVRTAAAVGVGAVLGGAGDMLKVITDMESAQADLNTTMAASGQTITPQLTKALDDAEGKGRKLGFTNADTVESFAKLVEAGYKFGDASNFLFANGGVMDLARAKHLALTDAVSVEVKAIQGNSRGLMDLNIQHLDKLATTDKLTADQKKQADAQDKVNSLQDKYNQLLADHGKSSKDFVPLQDAVTRAQINYQQAFDRAQAAGHDPNRDAATVKAKLSLRDAILALNDAEGKQGADAAKSNSELTKAHGELTKAQADLSDSTKQVAKDQGDLADRTHQTGELIAAQAPRIGGAAQNYAGTLGGALSAAKATVENIFEQAGTKEAQPFRDFINMLETHQGAIQAFANTVANVAGTGFKVIGNVLGWMLDHQQAILITAAAIAGIWAVDKIGSWGVTAVKAIDGFVNDPKIGQLGVKLMEKLFPNLSKVLNPPTATGPATPGASPAMSVGEMNVATLIAKSMVGGGGLPGAGGGAGDGVILGPDGKPLPHSTPSETVPTMTPEGGKLPLLPPAILGAAMLAPTIIPSSFSTDPAANPAVGNLLSDRQKTLNQQQLDTLLSPTLGQESASEWAQSLSDALSDRQSRAFGDLVGRLKSSPADTNDQVQGLLSNGNFTAGEKTAVQGALSAAQQMAYDQGTFLSQVTSLFHDEERDMAQAASIIYSTRQSALALEAQTTGARGAALNAGVGSVRPGGLGGHVSLAGGGVIRAREQFALLHGPEVVLRPEQAAALYEWGVITGVQGAGSNGSGGGNTFNINVYASGRDDAGDIARTVQGAIDESVYAGRLGAHNITPAPHSTVPMSIAPSSDFYRGIRAT